MNRRLPEKSSQHSPQAVLPKKGKLTIANYSLLEGAEKRQNPPPIVYYSYLLDQFEPWCVLGKGGFGCTIKVLQKTEMKEWAVKRIAVMKSSPHALEKALKEVRIQMKLDHEGIVRYKHSWTETPPKGWQEKIDAEILEKLPYAGNTNTEYKSPLLRKYDDFDFLYIQMELCTNTLRQVIRDGNDRDVEIKKGWMKEILFAVAYIHSKGVIHRDLKPDNILFREGRPKICDYGLCANQSFENGKSPEFTMSVGTPKYMSPEQKTNQWYYTHKIDVFSLGLIFLELLDTSSNKKEMEQAFEAFQLGNGSSYHLRHVPDLAGELLQSMLSFEGANRPECSEILKNPFLLSQFHHPTGNYVNIRTSEAPRHREFTESDVELLKKTICIEALSESSETQRAIAHVIINRVNANRGYFGGDTIQGVCLRERQFHWTATTPDQVNLAGSKWDKIDKIVRDVLAGNSEDPTNGAFNYVNLAQYNPPVWTKNLDEGVKIGNHQFYNERTTPSTPTRRGAESPEARAECSEEKGPAGAEGTTEKWFWPTCSSEEDETIESSSGKIERKTEEQ